MPTALLAMPTRAPSRQSPRIGRRQAVTSGVWSGLLVNALFAAAFAAGGMPALVAISLALCLLYAVSLWLVRVRRVGLASAFLVAGILTHLPLFVVALGLDSGFQYYLLTITPLVFVASPRTPRTAALIAAALGATFVGLDLVGRRVAPWYVLEASTLDAIRYVNAALAFSLAAAVAWTFSQRMLHAERRLARAANSDPLTGLGNRRHITGLTEQVLASRDRSGLPLSVMIADIDRFKIINDHHGHDVGDRVLKTVARTLGRTLRDGDHLARWGGEEFLVVLPGATLQEAESVADRARAAIASSAGGIPELGIAVTATFGVAEHRPGETLEATLKRADEALYRGKHQGRNRVSASPAGTAIPPGRVAPV